MEADTPLEPNQGIADIDELANSDKVFGYLAFIDWSFTNEDTSSLTHNLHPYPAKFIPQIPRNIIEHLSMPGDLVCDPFGGCGTTAVEAVRSGRRALSCDANPLSTVIGTAKVGFMSPEVEGDVQQLRNSITNLLQNILNTKGDGRTAGHPEYDQLPPPIPNIEKWFHPQVTAELCQIKQAAGDVETPLGQAIAYAAMSRIITRVSNQESETRYVAVPRESKPGQTLQAYLESLDALHATLAKSAQELQFADAQFLVGDSRNQLPQMTGGELVDLIVTSPPYPNATDYHLYHRFRMFWLGHDPRAMGRIEIGSHLRHQRDGTGFEGYREDMGHAIQGCYQILAPGRFAVLVVGSALYNGRRYDTADAIIDLGQQSGFHHVGTIDRPVHQTKRSFPNPGRRIATEQIVVLQKPNEPIDIILNPPDYRMWDHETRLRASEIEAITRNAVEHPRAGGPVNLRVHQPELWGLRRLTFTKEIVTEHALMQPMPTWQTYVENGEDHLSPSRRKNPQYATHGLHPFKGKFYPQLAKVLLNISRTPLGGRVLDPYCGSGTTLVEGMLNGFATYGCDLNPLAVKISQAKTAILTIPRDRVERGFSTLIQALEPSEHPIATDLDEFTAVTHPELTRWFSQPILYRLNQLLRTIRQLEDQVLAEFGEVIASSLIREISEQDPTDLRTRRRKTQLTDAPVNEMFRERLLRAQYHLRQYWAVAGRQPGPTIASTVVQGDSRNHETMGMLGLRSESIDCVITSPPYATALPYIDTDRLSLLAIMGIPRQVRSGIDRTLTGSREILGQDRANAVSGLLSADSTEILPPEVVEQIRLIHTANEQTTVGFRRANMAALLWRYFTDIKATLGLVTDVTKPEGFLFYLVGDSRTKAGNEWVRITTGDNIVRIAEMVGLTHVGTEEISVTTENYHHIKNAIRQNHILQFRKN